MESYLLTMCVAIWFALFAHSGQPLVRTAAVIMGNWLAVYGFNAVAGTYTPWLFWIALDSLCAALVLMKPAGKIQVLIAVGYMVQIAFHCAYGAISVMDYPSIPLIRHDYWEALLYPSYAQLALLACWGAGDGFWGLVSRQPRGGIIGDTYPDRGSKMAGKQ